MKILSLLLICLLICINLAFAQPSNDNCNNAISLVVNAPPVCGNTNGATIQAGEVTIPCGTVTANQSVWYKFTATQSNMDVWVENQLSKNCPLGSVIYNTSSCIPGVANIISCKPINFTSGIDYWHHLTGLTVGNTYLIQIIYRSGGSCGSGQNFCVSVVAPPTIAGYTQPTTGMNGENIGACMVNTCSAQFYDDGGPNGNYSNNVNLIYRTFCPNQAGKCIRATINYLDLEEGYDYLYVINGATQNDPSIAPCNPCSKLPNGTTFVASTQNGCLTFRFRSDATINYAGWNITLDCVNCSANTTGNTNTDACSATAVCNNQSFSGSSIGPGLSSDGCSGCNTSEHYTNWYYFCAQNSGNFTFTISPSPSSQDYDFALYGPNVSCGNLGAPIRCSYAAGNGNTGLNMTSTDVSESVNTPGADGWVQYLPVTAGQCFYLMVNKWDAGGSGFSVNFGSGVTLNCVVLPIELIDFRAFREGNYNVIQWVTATEKNNNYFILERSYDGINYQYVGKIKGAGNSYTTNHYEIIDFKPNMGTNYYRLSQTDYDGTTKIVGVVSVDFTNELKEIELKPNPTSDVSILSIPSYKEEECNIIVSDIAGSVIDKKDVYLHSGQNDFEINLSNAEKGIYFVSVKTRYSSKYFKIIKN